VNPTRRDAPLAPRGFIAQNAYRNGPLYASYAAAAMKGILDLNAKNHARIEGMLTWAFQFEQQPYFDGLRTLATTASTSQSSICFAWLGS